MPIRWTDARLDDLDDDVKELKRIVREDIKGLRDDIKHLSKAGADEHREQSREIDKINDRLQTFAESFNDVVLETHKRFNDLVVTLSERDAKRTAENRRAWLNFAGPIIAALCTALIGAVVVILVGPRP